LHGEKAKLHENFIRLRQGCATFLIGIGGPHTRRRRSI